MPHLSSHTPSMFWAPRCAHHQDCSAIVRNIPLCWLTCFGTAEPKAKKQFPPPGYLGPALPPKSGYQLQNHAPLSCFLPVPNTLRRYPKPEPWALGEKLLKLRYNADYGLCLPQIEKETIRHRKTTYIHSIVIEDIGFLTHLDPGSQIPRCQEKANHLMMNSNPIFHSLTD